MTMMSRRHQHHTTDTTANNTDVLGSSSNNSEVTDGEEEIEIETVPLTAIATLVAQGAITHSLVIAAFYHL